MLNLVNVDTYNWEGKLVEDDEDTNLHHLPAELDKENANPNAASIAPPRLKAPDVTVDMINLADDLATKSLGLRPSDIWNKVKKAMDDQHGEWLGHTRNYILDRVRRMCAEMNYGDTFRTIENKEYSLMTNSELPFLHNHTSIPHPDEPGVLQRIMVFANPALLHHLMADSVDLFIDATFKCCPHPFLQCLIVMCFDRATNYYVPVMYILMTHKNQGLYWYAFSQILILSDWKLQVRSYTCDFEMAMINTGKDVFQDCFHVGCLFHLKQAWRRYLITKIGFLPEQIGYAMRSCVLDLLTVISPDKIE